MSHRSLELARELERLRPEYRRKLFKAYIKEQGLTIEHLEKKTHVTLGRKNGDIPSEFFDYYTAILPVDQQQLLHELQYGATPEKLRLEVPVWIGKFIQELPIPTLVHDQVGDIKLTNLPLRELFYGDPKSLPTEVYDGSPSANMLLLMVIPEGEFWNRFTGVDLGKEFFMEQQYTLWLRLNMHRLKDERVQEILDRASYCPEFYDLIRNFPSLPAQQILTDPQATIYLPRHDHLKVKAVQLSQLLKIKTGKDLGYPFIQSNLPLDTYTEKFYCDRGWCWNENMLVEKASYLFDKHWKPLC